MPVLTEVDAIAAHVRACLAARDRWLFLALDEFGRGACEGIAYALLMRGCPLAELGLADVNFKSLTTRHALPRLSVLSVPKSRLCEGRVRALYRTLARAEWPAGRDLIAIAGGDVDEDAVRVFLESCRQGRVRAPGCQGVN